MIHALSTGQVRITRNWLQGKGQGAARLVSTMLDTQYTDWLPVWCFVIEHAGGLIVVDTGIPEDANAPVYFPPHMPLLQRAATFRIEPGCEIGHQMRRLNLDPGDVHTVILTHLHQDHDGGLHHFPHAEFIVSRTEWDAARGFAGRMNGYLNQRWPEWFSPTLIDFSDGPFAAFPASHKLATDLILVPTPGHSAGHMSLVMDHADTRFMFIGDTAYSETALLNEIVDGVTLDSVTARQSMRRVRATMQSHNSIVLPGHDSAVPERLRVATGAEAVFLSQ